MKSKDHNFDANQKAEYDSLSARGRTAYDVARWSDETLSHARAFTAALNEHGLKKTV